METLWALLEAAELRPEPVRLIERLAALRHGNLNGLAVCADENEYRRVRLYCGNSVDVHFRSPVQLDLQRGFGVI